MERQYLEDDYLYEDEDAMSCLRELRSKIDYAKKNGNVERAFELYYQYVKDDALYFSGYNAYCILPEYIEYYNGHTEYEEQKLYVMLAFKKILPIIDGFSCLSISDIRDCFELYKNCCIRYGYSLRSYYRILWYFLYSHKESDSHFEISVKEAHKKGMEEKRDSLSDNEAIEAYDDFTYYLDVEDNEAEAIRIISPYLKKENRYGSVPHQSYYYLARYYFDKGQIGKSIKFAKTALVMIEKDYPDYSCFMTICSILFDIISIRYKEKAFRTFKKLLNCLEKCQNQASVFTFYECSYRMFYRLEKSGVDSVVISFPKWLSCCSFDTSNEYSTKEIKEFFFSKAKELADQFDSINHFHEFNDSLNEIPVLKE